MNSRVLSYKINPWLWLSCCTPKLNEINQIHQTAGTWAKFWIFMPILASFQCKVNLSIQGINAVQKRARLRGCFVYQPYHHHCRTLLQRIWPQARWNCRRCNPLWHSLWPWTTTTCNRLLDAPRLKSTINFSAAFSPSFFFNWISHVISFWVHGCSLKWILIMVNLLCFTMKDHRHSFQVLTCGSRWSTVVERIPRNSELSGAGLFFFFLH